MTGDVLAAVRDRPGRTAYAIARDLGHRYPSGRVRADPVCRELYRLEAARLVRAEDGPTPCRERVFWYPAEGEF